MPANTPKPSSLDTPESFRTWLGGWERKRKTFELDNINKKTVFGGYGHDLGRDQRHLIGQPVSDDGAHRWLDGDITAKSIPVAKLVNPHVWDRMTPEQKNALVSLVFNVSVGRLGRSQTLARLNEGDFIGAGQEWLRFNRVGGKPIEGLARRRADEARRFLGTNAGKIIPDENYRRWGLWQFPEEPLPQV